MIRISIIGLFVLVFIGIVFMFNNKNNYIIGAYDPSGQYKMEQRIKIDSHYYAWSDEVNKLNEINLDSNRDLLLTVEPWMKSGQSLQTITSGEYDNKIIQICEKMIDFSQVYIRWGHEMELTQSRYPWTNQKTNEYIDAYRHFYGVCKKILPNAKFVWSPAGDLNLENYWPGADYVDVVGISLYSYDLWNDKNIGKSQSFSEILKPKYDRVKIFNKPVMIAEMGVTGDDEYKNKWIYSALDDLNKYPLIRYIIIFNSTDIEGTWGKDLPTPIWDLPEESINNLLNID